MPEPSLQGTIGSMIELNSVMRLQIGSVLLFSTNVGNYVTSIFLFFCREFCINLVVQGGQLTRVRIFNHGVVLPFKGLADSFLKKNKTVLTPS